MSITHIFVLFIQLVNFAVAELNHQDTAYSCTTPMFSDEIHRKYTAFYSIQSSDKSHWVAKIGKSRIGFFDKHTLTWSDPFRVTHSYGAVEDRKCINCEYIEFSGTLHGDAIRLYMGQYYDHGWQAIGGGMSRLLHINNERAEFLGVCRPADIQYDLQSHREELRTLVWELVELAGRTDEFELIE